MLSTQSAVVIDEVFPSLEVGTPGTRPLQTFHQLARQTKRHVDGGHKPQLFQRPSRTLEFSECLRPFFQQGFKLAQRGQRKQIIDCQYRPLPLAYSHGNRFFLRGAAGKINAQQATVFRVQTAFSGGNKASSTAR
ncbi:hypothetical protein [Limnobacter sp.]|uniref:hypothetical protein n=1 Tax=Limnobacter sp. TaxID=2003368 RepID=UPI003BAC744C